MAKGETLTDKQERFCQEYLKDLNATQAAIRSGYSENTAQEIGSQNLSKLIIQNRIQQLQVKLQKKTEITQERVIAEYAKIAFADPRNFFNDNNNLLNVKELPDNEAGVLSSLEIEVEKDPDTGEITTTKKIKFWDKIKALEGLGKHLGLFERDNTQKQPQINLSAMNADDLNKLLGLKTKVGMHE